MRNMVLVTVAALALTACGQKNNGASVNMADANSAMEGNMTVAENDSADNGAATASVSTADFVKNAAMGDMYEIAASKLAGTMATSADVKKFAADMITAHTATTAGLKSAIAKDDVGEKPPAELDADHKTMIDALKGAKGDAFDALYKSQQTDAHTKALALMQNYSVSGDKPALKTFASETAPKVKSHLDMLKALG